MSERRPTCIKDIYSGKPDARDEAMINHDRFLRSYVMPPNFDMRGLMEGDKFLISGYKGTGKTALLLYLAEKFKQIDETSRTSFILFKSDFDNRKRDQWAKTMTVEREGFLTLPDFSAMWRWHIFQQMVEDNEKHNGRIFVEDAAWEEFSRLVMAMVPQKEKRRGLGGGKITFGLPVLGGLLNPKMDVAFTLENGEKEERNFYDLIEETTDAFCQLQRTEVPYYIFLDELEAFYGDTEIFFRDLRMIRDLILEAKAVNMLMHSLGMGKTKIICAVRSEIISSINRFIESKEVNKVVDGFDCPLIWNYVSGASFSHPIIEILLKRIELSELMNGAESVDREDLQRRWFPEKIDNTDPVQFILNHNWSKPRDIVRLISAAQDSLHFEADAFSRAVLGSSLPQYSRNSLTELREELRALYRAQEIDDIINCFTGFEDTFTLDMLRKHVQDYYPHSVLATRTLDVLNDLYRLGIIGNMNAKQTSRYRWQHRGDDRIILNDDWLITIHRGLRKALSTIPSKLGKKPAPKPQEATVFGQSANPALIGSEVTLREISTAPNGIKGSFDGHVGTVSRRRLGGLPPALFSGGTLQVRVLGLNPIGGSYELEPADEYPLPGREQILSGLWKTAEGDVCGHFGTPHWKGEGVIPAADWQVLGCIHSLKNIQLRVKAVGYDPEANRFRLELGEDAVILLNDQASKETPQKMQQSQLPPPDMEAVYQLRVQGRTNNGGIRGVFGDRDWPGTVSRLRLEEKRVFPQSGDVLTVRVDRKNPLGESWALFIVEE